MKKNKKKLVFYVWMEREMQQEARFLDEKETNSYRNTAVQPPSYEVA